MTPQFIQHRVNKIADLKNVDQSFGVEIDLRSSLSPKGELYLSHDPWQPGDHFEEWLREFCSLKIRGPIILNTKEDGLETQIVEKIADAGIDNYFFLDTAIPTLIRWPGNRNVAKFAARLSTHEPMEQALALRSFAKWLWVDCFEGIPMDTSMISTLKNSFKICLVSPELHGKPLELISNFETWYRASDAICTKFADAWLKQFR